MTSKNHNWTGRINSTNTKILAIAILSKIPFGTIAIRAGDLNVRIQLGVAEQRAEVGASIGHVSVCRPLSLPLHLPVDSAVGHRNVVADLIAYGWNGTRHAVLQVFDVGIALALPSAATRRVPSKHRLEIVSMHVAVHFRLASDEGFDVLANDPLELPLNGAAIRVTIDLKLFREKFAVSTVEKLSNFQEGQRLNLIKYLSTATNLQSLGDRPSREP